LTIVANLLYTGIHAVRLTSAAASMTAVAVALFFLPRLRASDFPLRYFPAPHPAEQPCDGFVPSLLRMLSGFGLPHNSHLIAHNCSHRFHDAAMRLSDRSKPFFAAFNPFGFAIPKVHKNQRFHGSMNRFGS
jgi:hypothetical protein